MDTAIIWPTVALVVVIYAVWFLMYQQRFAHMKRTPPRPEEFASGEAAMRYFQPVEMPANNFRNLFELPVLYFGLVPLLLVTNTATDIQVALAWAFVALRVVHSWIHSGSGPVQRRFMVYLAGSVVLLAMWIGFAVDIARSGAG